MADGEHEELISLEMTERERALLVRGLTEWGGGPAQASPQLAVAMGFTGVEDLVRGDGLRIQDAFRHHRPLSRTDWNRALLATEIAFASNVMGSGSDWEITSGWSDEETIWLLREVQSTIPGGWPDLVPQGLCAHTPPPGGRSASGTGTRGAAPAS
jgi:hypothetical protein